MTVDRHLLVFPRPKIGECARAFAWRLSKMNGLQSPALLVKHHSSKRCLEDGLWDIYRKNLSAESLNVLSNRLKRADERNWLRSGFRVCPICYKSEPYLRNKWQYALAPVCRAHRRPLQELGPISKLDWCLDDLSLWGHPEELGEGDTGGSLELQEYIEFRLGFIDTCPTTHVARHLKNLTIDQIAKLLILLGGYLSHGLRFQPRKAPVKSSSQAAFEVLAAAASVLCTRDLDMNLFLDRLISTKEKCRSLQARIGYVHMAMNRELRDNEFKPFKDAYYAAVRAKWPESIDIKSSAVSRAKNGNYTSGTAFSRSVGVSSETTVRWIESKRIAGHIRTTRNGRRQISVKNGQLEKARRLMSSFSLKEAAEYLGLKKKAVRLLIESGDIAACRATASGPWYLERATLDWFTSRLAENSKNLESKIPTVTLDRFMRYYAPKGVSQHSVLMALLAGQLNFRLLKSRGRLSKRLCLEAESCRDWCIGSSQYTVPALARMLKVKQDVAYHLINQGFIESSSRGRIGRVVGEKAINSFKGRYVLGRDLASQLGVSPKSLAASLSVKGINPVSGPGIDRGRQLVYLRSEALNSS